MLTYKGENILEKLVKKSFLLHFLYQGVIIYKKQKKGNKMNDVFSIKEYSFPKGFEWGSSTAGHQIEGDNVNSGHWDREQTLLKENPNYEVSGKACNSYEMYEEDIKLLKELGHGVYRMSIEWSRIEPNEGEWNKDAVEHYVKQLSRLKEEGIKVFLTLSHFTVPAWLAKRGTFQTLENVDCFLKFVEFIVPKIAQYVDRWNVLNEFNGGMAETNKRHKFNCTIAHAKAYGIIKKYSNKPVSTAHAYMDFFPVRRKDKFDNALADYYDAFCNEFFFHAIRTGELVMEGIDGIYDKEIKNSLDFWSINLYDRKMRDARRKGIRGRRYDATYTPMIDYPFYLDEFYPEIMVHALTRLSDKPIFISENGCSADDDRFRIVYITEYLSALSQAIKMGAEVEGYCYWSLLDNYEWNSFKPRFGLVNVDRENGFKRTIKPSGYFLKEIIQNNGFKPEMLKKYLTELPKVTYSPNQV